MSNQQPNTAKIGLGCSPDHSDDQTPFPEQYFAHTKPIESSEAFCVASPGVTSPPLASYSELLQNDGRLELLDFDYLPNDSCQHGKSHSIQSDENVRTQMLDEVELVSFSLAQQRKNSSTTTPHPASGIATTERSTDSISPKVGNLLNVWNLDDDISWDGSHLETQTRKYSDERGYRKNSREKLRRQEVNKKFDVLVDVLGFTNRVRKHVVLQEAVSTIEILQWERNKLLMDRERLQQEVNRLVIFQQQSAANDNSLIPLPNRPFLDEILR